MKKGHHHEGCKGDHDHGNRALLASLVVIAVVIVMNGGLGWSELYIFRNHEDSSSLFADGLHNLSDMLASLLAASGLAVSIAIHASVRWTNGLQKGPTFTALLNYVLLNGLMLWAMYQAVLRIHTPREFSGKTIFMVGTAALVVNLISTVLLHRHKGESENMAAAFWHHAVDLMSSAAVMVAGYLYELLGWTLVDPILTIGISVLVIGIGSRGAWKSLIVLLDGTPQEINSQGVVDFLEGFFGADRFHALRLRGSEGETEASVHVEIDLDQTLHDDLRRKVSTELQKLGVTHADIVIHPLKASCPRRNQRFGNGRAQGWTALAHLGHSH